MAEDNILDDTLAIFEGSVRCDGDVSVGQHLDYKNGISRKYTQNNAQVTELLFDNQGKFPFLKLKPEISPIYDINNKNPLLNLLYLLFLLLAAAYWIYRNWRYIAAYLGLPNAYVPARWTSEFGSESGDGSNRGSDAGSNEAGEDTLPGAGGILPNIWRHGIRYVLRARQGYSTLQGSVGTPASSFSSLNSLPSQSSSLSSLTDSFVAIDNPVYVPSFTSNPTYGQWDVLFEPDFTQFSNYGNPLFELLV